MPTQTKENYLKAIYSISEKNKSISLTEIAELLNISKPTANSMVKKLQENNWVKYEKYKPLKLTSTGKKIAASIVRKHRLTEMFLTTIMNFGWEEVHEIAEEMEHIKTDKLFDRMDEMLGYPKEDPHGSPIPDKSGKTAEQNYIKLSSLKVGEEGQIGGLSNSSKALLVYLNKKGISLGTKFKIESIETFDHSISIETDDGKNVFLTEDVIKSLLVEKL